MFICTNPQTPLLVRDRTITTAHVSTKAMQPPRRDTREVQIAPPEAASCDLSPLCLSWASGAPTPDFWRSEPTLDAECRGLQWEAWGPSLGQPLPTPYLQGSGLHSDESWGGSGCLAMSITFQAPLLPDTNTDVDVTCPQSPPKAKTKNQNSTWGWGPPT